MRGQAWRFHHWTYGYVAYLDDYGEFTAPLYRYDAGANGKGQRTSMADPSGSTTWAYP